MKNEKEEAPLRVQPGVAGTPDKGHTDGDKKKLLFGSEKLNVSLVLEIVDFAEVAAK